MQLKYFRLALFLIPFFVLIFNEYLIYYLSYFQCSWPAVGRTNVLIIADTHLLGIYRGHWFDKLRREWQMYRSFQTAISMFNPHAIFFLGDLFDEGLIGNDKTFHSYFERFNELFDVAGGIERFVVMGNHDIGFHHEIFPQRLNRFTKKFQVSNSVDHVEVDGNIFILLNSMAMEGDYCRLCAEAVDEVEKISQLLKCTQQFTEKCSDRLNVNYSRPIVMQHFPLFRRSDESCDETLGIAPSNVRQQKFREKFDCLSEDSTNFLLAKLSPRAAFGGHTHYECKKWWKNPIMMWEYTVASLSWRNNHHPSFLLLSVSPLEMSVSSCFVPDEYLVIGIYVVAFLTWISLVFINFLPIIKKRRWHRLKVNKISKVNED